jgi:N-acetylglutamate synthase-like GNAT family acetyltransferase
VREGGSIVACASLRIDGRLAQLCGTATVPAMRRRGLQTALVRHRLAAAAAAGCDLAVVTTAPGSKSQQNMARAGFELLYARAVLERPIAQR